MVKPIEMEQMTDPAMIEATAQLRRQLAEVVSADDAPGPFVSLSALTVLTAQTIEFLVENGQGDVETLVDKVANSMRVIIASRQAKKEKGN